MNIKYQFAKYCLCFVSLLIFSNCNKDDKVAPQASAIVFTNSTSVEIDLDGLNNNEKVNVIATDLSGNTIEFSGLTGQPIVISPLKEGEIYSFQFQLEYENNRGKTKQSDFGAATQLVLASKNMDTQFSRIDMLQRINAARSEARVCGTQSFAAAPPLVWNDLLEDASEIHSMDMETYDFFGHQNPVTLQKTDDRLQTVKYPYSRWAENIAISYPTVETVFKAWIESPSHCVNIMDPKNKEVGVFKQGKYWTQVFGAR